MEYHTCDEGKRSGPENRASIACERVEPDKDNVRCINTKYRDVVVIEAAVWSENMELRFDLGKGMNSAINDGEGTAIVQARTIDGVEECRDATFIKLDIEGSEYNALLGAE